MTHPTPLPSATILGYPRIGRHRELKKALESFWAGRTDEAAFEAAAAQVRATNLDRLRSLGLSAEQGIPLDFSHDDQVLDAVLALGALPPRFADFAGDGAARLGVDAEFALARGTATVPPLEMTKWFDSNYHYLVPEIGPNTTISYRGSRRADHVREAADAGINGRPVIVGPVTFLLLAKGEPAEYNTFDRLGGVIGAYVDWLRDLREAGAQWVQLDEPALVSDTWAASQDEVRDAVVRAYSALATVDAAERPALLVAAPYGPLPSETFGALVDAGVEAIALDLVKGSVPDAGGRDLSGLTLLGGVVDGHNVWRTDLDAAAAKLEPLRALGAGAVVAATSTSLLHVPHTVEDELTDPHPLLPERIATWLAFADEKVAEVAAIAAGPEGAPEAFAAARAALADRAGAPGVVVPQVRERAAALEASAFTREAYPVRRDAQAVLNLPPLPTTTIGSFPQTGELRAARAALRKGELSDAAYVEAMRAEVARVIALQEELGLDVLVHGEPERNDMVQYFAELLDGFAVTRHGWVQSYGSRCTRPSILWGDVTRPAPMTVEWATHASSLTPKPVKGMLTGPVTILAWSFVRDDQPLGETANQVALALRDEIADLEAAGIAIIQVDEPALRELLPLRQADREAYLDWSVASFRLATSGVVAATQIHTHLCYSEFEAVFGAIDALDADVTSIEAARSRMELLPAVAASGFERGIGPGVWDIHSPRVPSTSELVGLLELALESVGERSLWVNPDCGLKTRAYPETTATLTNLVAAAQQVRAGL